MSRILIFIQISLLIIGLTGCVGTIKTANSANTKSSDSIDSAVQSYVGIYSATAVANDKIEILFPQIGSEADSIAYVIRYDGQVTPLYVNGSSLRPHWKNYLKYTIKGLNVNSSYALSVQARNIKTQAESTNNLVKTASTFSNLTANFMGISDLQNLSGIDGAKGIKVFWLPAEVKGYDVQPNEIDPASYQITVINKKCGITLMNDATAPADCERKVFYASANDRSIIINGLTADTIYMVQVRCIHYGVSQNSANSSYKTETNTTYLEIRTFSEDSSSVPFSESSLVYSLPDGIAGSTSVKVKWNSALGAFDHYRIYYAPTNGNTTSEFNSAIDHDPGCLVTTVNSKTFNCLFVNSTNVNATIAGLKNDTSYDFYFVICSSFSCDSSHRKVVPAIKVLSTSPSVARFSGIKTILAAKDLDNLNNVELNFNPADISTGAIYGYLIKFYGTSPFNMSPRIINDSSYDGPLGYLAFDKPANELTKITVTGVPIGIQSCFKVVPYILKQNGDKLEGDTSTTTPTCVTPVITAPTADQFKGFSNYADPFACDVANRSMTLSWISPTVGVFSKYEIFYSYTAGASDSSFNFTTLKSGTNRIEVSSKTNTITITNLDPGYTYTFGILTKYQPAGGDVMFSDDNTQKLQCKIP